MSNETISRKDLHSVFQSRVAKRSAQITRLEKSSKYFKGLKMRACANVLDTMLKALRAEQYMDKSIIRTMIW